MVILTWYHMTLKVNFVFFFVTLILTYYLIFFNFIKILKTSSPKMLFIVLFGAIVSYSEVI